MMNLSKTLSTFVCAVTAFCCVLAAITTTSGDEPAGRQTSYTTTFSKAENPISDGGKWVSGKTEGVDWEDVVTDAGLVYGTQTGLQEKSLFNDSIAFLTGEWAPNQAAWAKVKSQNQQQYPVYEEVEIFLRGSLMPHIAQGYEINFRSLNAKESYCEIVRWNGALNDFTYLKQARGIKSAISDGDTVKGTIVGNVITAYINDQEVARATDDRYSGGSPGVGFWLLGASGLNRDYGFTEYTAISLKPDGSGAVPKPH